MKKVILLNLLITLSFTMSAQPAFTSYAAPASSSTYPRTAIKIDAAGNKWYGSSGKGAYKFDGSSWTIYNTTGSFIASDYVNDFAFDASNNAWMATRAGLSKFNGSTWTTYNTSNSGLSNDTVNCVFVNGTDVWAGTRAGLARFDGSSWTVYNTTTSGIISNNITALNVNAAGDLWVGTATGLSVKSGATWTNYSAANSNLSFSIISCIYFESATVAWIGTRTMGIYRFENMEFRPLSSMYMKKNINFPVGVNTISKGPNGGMLFSGQYGSTNGFLEVINDQINYYAFPPTYGSAFHVYESSTSRVWFITPYGSASSNNLYAFDYSVYPGTQQVQDRPSFEVLDVNNVQAGILNRGDLHWNLYSAAYEVPKNSGRHAIFASALWIGGIDNSSNLHQAAMTYRQTGNDYWPGPLDTITGTTDSATSEVYDKIWKLNRSEIEEFQAMYASGAVTAGTYTPAYNILNWPAHGSGNYTRSMAPFVDVNGDGLYNPVADGDYPKIKGDQMCYWIFNDRVTHTLTNSTPLGVEIHASAYAYSCDSLNGIDSLKGLNYTTFYDYEVYNRGTLNYHDTYIGLWQNYHLGNYNDDFVGSNPEGNYAFIYNADSIDESSGAIAPYGRNPPIYSNVILDGPLAIISDGVDNNNNGITDEPGEKNLLTSALFSTNNASPETGSPYTASHFYNYMQSRWKSGTHVVYGGNGTGPGVPYNFMYDGLLDGTPWSEISENNFPDDKRAILGSGPFDFNTGAKFNYGFAIVYTRDNAPAYNIVNLYDQNLADVRKIKQWYAADNFPSCAPSVSTGITAPQQAAPSLLLYPNPASNMIMINYQPASITASVLEIYNVQGQLIKHETINSNVSVDVSGFTTGLYIVKISDNGKIISKKFLKE